MNWPTCHDCGGDITDGWIDKRTEIARGKCDRCGHIRVLTGTEFGRLRMMEAQTGRFNPFDAAERAIGGMGAKK